MPKVVIDYEQCDKLVFHIVQSGGVPKDREDPMPYSFPASVEENAWWALVGINHQTTPVVGVALKGYVDGKLLRGWDYLLQKAVIETNRNPELFTANWLANVSEAELRAIYHDPQEGDTLVRIDERAWLLRDMGSFLIWSGWASVRDAYEAAEGFIKRENGLSIAGLLRETDAYADPVEKKLFYFLAIMQNRGLWTYRDPENLSSPVNYHEQRGHFRLGTVRIIDAELKRRVSAKENIESDEDLEIRFAVRRAIEYVAEKLGVTPSAAHYFFWNYFRNCCAREKAHCNGCGTACALPERYRMGTDRCLFAGVCKSAGTDVRDMLIEPRLDTTIWQ